jgi:PLP dependent protein
MCQSSVSTESSQGSRASVRTNWCEFADRFAADARLQYVHNLEKDERARIRCMSSASQEIAKNFADVRQRIDQAASRAGRRADEITLVAVTKTHPTSKIVSLYEAGARHFGENRVQERESKLDDTANLDATWHMIGHLQKNKAARVPRMFDTVDSVDSIALAEKLDRAEGEYLKSKNVSGDLNPHADNRRLRVLIEVKLDPEPAKSGASDEEVPRLVEAVLRLPYLNLQGLMGVPPYFDNPQDARPYFRHLRELRDSLRQGMEAQSLPVLSMGMSHDFEIAIEEGATEVRVGTSLFGQRDYTE